jgi:cobaltochelatase CobN
LHLLVRETRSLDEEQAAVDLGQTPADLVLLSFSDADLGAAAMAWQAMGADRPSLRLANLSRLRHPMSVDLYVENVVSHARAVVVRLLGGLDYWPYGVQELFSACRAKKIPLAVVPGDARDDPRLLEFCTAPAAAVAALDSYLRHGGPANLEQALRLAAYLAGIAPPPELLPERLPNAGVFSPARRLDPLRGSSPQGEGAFGTATIVLYRSHLLAGDVAPIEALSDALRERGFDVRALYVSSLKDPAAGTFVADRLRDWRPSVVLNATAFAAGQDGAGSPLDAAGAPVLQLILAGAEKPAWAASSRGLSQSDMAMQVVLPELDGRLLTTAISFKAETETVPGLDFSRVVNRPDPDGIALAADRALGWARLAATPANERRVAVVLSDYPGAGGGQVGHAVGLETFASLAALLEDLSGAGYATGAPLSAKALTDVLCHAAPTPFLDLTTYETLFAALPVATREKIGAAWGDPADDPAVRDGNFSLRHAMLGKLVVAVQPDRGNALDRKATYHDPDLPPRHPYAAFYLWLRCVEAVHALVHLGTHGTLEWLPGKAVALSDACVPVALARGLPVIYPFIVNNPGEAAAAKRRLGAVTIGHLTPPLRAAGTHGAAADLERLIDEYAAADGLDRRRAKTLRRDILERAETAGLLAESGVARGAPDDEALARLDAYLCDVKDLQIRDGLHVFGRAPSAERRELLAKALVATPANAGVRSHPNVGAVALDSGFRRNDDREACSFASRSTAASPSAAVDASAPAERAALLAALAGKFVAAGPAGAPSRGRADVLPTGRNLFAIDPRAVPTRSAVALAERAADDLLRRHLQDHGDWPRALVIDLWGSATLRTGGEDFALALLLLGARPVWDEGSARVSGVEILPLAVLDRPRVDVTLRISGLFRDAFEAQILLFDAAVRAVAARDEAGDFNQLAAAARGLDGAALRRATARVFGAAPGGYGAGVSDVLERGAWRQRDELGDAYLAASAHAYGHDLLGVADAEGFSSRVAAADAFVHVRDHAETDLLEGTEHAAHEGGFAAAAARLGAAPALYHLDTSRPEAPRSRTVAEEIARVARGRAANPAWLAGMMRHGYRGASEIARALDGLHGFAATLPQRFDAQFDLLFDATLGDAAVDAFLRAKNPDAREAMAAKFRDALRRDLWRPRRNVPPEMLAP